ncbi:MAG TPA: ADP-ribosylglycohydrolase family protein [Armatimonadota bacterium]|nr:ADP-ribosylglycohydrolase family protein [Armatimonadota bacterium]
MTIRDRVLGGLWGAIVGDALGVPVEFTSREERRRDPITGMRGYGTHQQPLGTWSDDSSLLLCTVEALCEKDYSVERLAKFFLAWQDHGYWTPYGTVFDIGIATNTALSRMRCGIAPEEAGGAGERDNGNGSLMRILPVALRYVDKPIEEMLFMAHRISALTHRHPRSQMACGLYCCLVKGLLYGLTPLEAYRFMVDQGQRCYGSAPFYSEYGHFARVLSGKLADLLETDIASSGYVVHTLEASVWCLLTCESYEETVLKAVNLGEDTDTTGCVAGGLAGVHYSFPSIPQSWVDVIARKDNIDELIEAFSTH